MNGGSVTRVRRTELHHPSRYALEGTRQKSKAGRARLDAQIIIEILLVTHRPVYRLLASRGGAVGWLADPT
jgi:hypothetical protein